MSFGGPSAADRAAMRRQEQQTENDLVDSIQADTARTTRMRARIYGLGFQPATTPATGGVRAGGSFGFPGLAGALFHRVGA